METEVRSISNAAGTLMEIQMWCGHEPKERKQTPLLPYQGCEPYHGSTGHLYITTTDQHSIAWRVM